MWYVEGEWANKFLRMGRYKYRGTLGLISIPPARTNRYPPPPHRDINSRFPLLKHVLMYGNASANNYVAPQYTMFLKWLQIKIRTYFLRKILGGSIFICNSLHFKPCNEVELLSELQFCLPFFMSDRIWLKFSNYSSCLPEDAYQIADKSLDSYENLH